MVVRVAVRRVALDARVEAAPPDFLVAGVVAGLFPDPRIAGLRVDDSAAGLRVDDAAAGFAAAGLVAAGLRVAELVEAALRTEADVAGFRAVADAGLAVDAALRAEAAGFRVAVAAGFRVAVAAGFRVAVLALEADPRADDAAVDGFAGFRVDAAARLCRAGFATAVLFDGALTGVMTVAAWATAEPTVPAARPTAAPTPLAASPAVAATARANLEARAATSDAAAAA